jgi:2-oxoglutarate decarboxylase
VAPAAAGAHRIDFKIRQEEAINAVAQSGEHTAAQTLAQFGANEWLVDEMYQQYLKDPSSVDKAWWDFFEDYQPVDRVGTVTGRPSPNGDATPAAVTKQPPTAADPTGPDARADGAPATAGAPTSKETTAAKAAPASTPKGDATEAPRPSFAGSESVALKGAAARVVSNMEASLTVPTATSVRSIPAKLLIDNRVVINNHLKRGRGGKVSFTHLIGYAVIKALAEMPEMNNGYAEVDAKPTILKPEHVNFGLAIDIQKPDGSRTLLVPSIKGAEKMDFAAFWSAYEDIVRRARTNKLTADDFAGTTISLTNPGTIGTIHSVPRLMAGQGTIVGVGAMEYPAEYQGAAPETLARLAVSKIVTLTSTYDHRIIQGAQSGDFLRRIHALLLGEDGFYDDIFRALRLPYEPIRWVRDISASHEDDVVKQARVQELIHAYRVRGHLMADTDPLEFRQR